MLHLLAQRIRKHVQHDLSGDEEQRSEEKISQRPAVLQRERDEQDLHDDVDEQEEPVEQVEDDEEGDGVGRAEAGPALKGHDRDDKGDGKHEHGRAAQQPDGQPRAVLVQLEADEAVDQQARAQRRREAALHGDEPCVRVRALGDHAGVDEEGGDGENEEEVEECCDFLAAWSRLC